MTRFRFWRMPRCRFALAWQRSGLAAGCLVVASLSGCGGGGGTQSTPPPVAQDPPVVVNEKSLSAARTGELLSYFRERLVTSSREGVMTMAPGQALADGSVTYSGTTVQEAGVDEDDLLKTDGVHLYSLRRASFSAAGVSIAPRLQIHQRQTDGRTTSVSTLALPADLGFSGIYLAAAASRVIAVGSRDFIDFPTLDLPVADARPATLAFAPQGRPTVRLELIDVRDPAQPAITRSVSIDGRLTASRLIGNRLYLVTQWLPTFPWLAYPTDDASRQAALARLSTTDLLPSITVTGAPAQPLVAEKDCFVQRANASGSTELTTLTVMDISSPTLTRTSQCFVGGTEAIYLSPANLYLATTRYPGITGTNSGSIRADTSTDLHKFALTADGLDYRGTGNVVGHLGWDLQKKSLRLSEHAGDLRVLSFTGTTGWAQPATAPRGIAASPATLSILRERASDRSLVTVSELPNAKRPAPLGLPGEQVYAVRFAGPRAYVVTFRQIDPLYVLDLSDPADPKTVGELKATGYSDYLFPIDAGLLLGVGKEADANGLVGGVKLALFDVSDPARPRELATRLYGGRGSVTALDSDRHGINLFSVGDITRVALPVRMNSTPTPQAGWFAPTRQGLLRLDIDRAARTLVERPMLLSVDYSASPERASAYDTYDVGQERSVGIGDHIHYLSGGQLLSAPWAGAAIQ